MEDFLSKLIDSMDDAGLLPSNPSSIVPDDKLSSYHIAGDRPGAKKGFYRLAVDPQGDFAYGYFGDYRIGEPHAWHARTARRLSREEREGIDRRMEEARQRAAQEEIRRHGEMAQEARDFLLFLDPAPFNHPYLIRKKIHAYGALVSGQDLIIPMQDAAQVWSYQSIAPDGQKLYFGGQPGARARGLWFKIPGDTTICVCEGFATGASIHAATGHTVYVTFSAGNMVACAREIRLIHPASTIIFCADNDHYKRDKNGVIIQTGVKKAIEAANLVGGYVTYPKTEDLLGGEDRTDFNDLHELCGLQAVADRISGFCKKPSEIQSAFLNGGHGEAVAGGELSPQVPHTPLPDSDWRTCLVTKKNGDIQERSTTNLLLIMLNDDELNGLFKYDSFAKHIIVFKCPPWEDRDRFSVRSVQDYDYIRLESFLETKYSLKTGRDKCADAIISTAQLPANTFNPASDYFSSLKWDGGKRLDTWIKYYVGDGSQSDEYIAMVGRKFMCGLAARAMRPGIKFDTMIILEGKQNGGKSRLAHAISTINGVEYFLDDFRDIDNKDSLMKMQGKLVVEFPEITTMRRAEVNELKGFLSRQTDAYRAPYGRNTIEAPRQCVFVGTVNPEGEYLRDITGNRRYWPIACRDKIDLVSVSKIMPHLHAEAAFLVQNGEQLWLNDDEYELAEIEQGKRVQADIWTNKVEDALLGQNWISTDEVMEALNIPLERRSSYDAARVAKIMTSLGWEPNRKRAAGGAQKRGWTRKEVIFGDAEDLPL